MADGSSAQQDESFEEWLICRMRQLELDEDVFGSYVTGVLDSEDTDEDRKDALIGILEGMTVGTCTYILLTKHESRTGRISAQGLDSTDRGQRGPYKKGPIFPRTVSSKLG